MASVKIGGVDYEIPPFTFKQLKQSWPLINKVSQSSGKAEDLDEIEDLFGIVSIGLSRTDNPFSVEEIEGKIMAAEVPLLESTISQIMEDAGLVKTDAEGKIIVGEAEGAPAASPSTETSTDSSQSLSPPVAPEVTGTA